MTGDKFLFIKEKLSLFVFSLWTLNFLSEARKYILKEGKSLISEKLFAINIIQNQA